MLTYFLFELKVCLYIKFIHLHKRFLSQFTFFGLSNKFYLYLLLGTTLFIFGRVIVIKLVSWFDPHPFPPNIYMDISITYILKGEEA